MRRVTLTAVPAVLTLVLLLCAFCLPLVRESAAPAAEAAPVKGTLTTVGQGDHALKVLVLEGSPYEMGYAQGVLLKDEVKGLIADALPTLLGTERVVLDQIDQTYRQQAPYIPEAYKEEMRGLSDGSGVPLEMVQRAQVLPETAEFACSACAAWGKATRDGHFYQVRNLDWEVRAHVQDYAVIVVYKPDHGVPFVNVTWAGFLGVFTGINAEKIAIGSIGDYYGREHERYDGITVAFLARRVLQECRTLDEAVAMIRDARRTSAYVYCVGDGKTPDARGFHTAADIFECFGPGQFPPPYVPMPQAVYMYMGRGGIGRLHDRLKAHYGDIAPDNLMSDVIPATGMESANLHEVISDNTALKLWIANAGPDGSPAFSQPYVEFDAAPYLSPSHQGPGATQNGVPPGQRA